MVILNQTLNETLDGTTHEPINVKINGKEHVHHHLAAGSDATLDLGPFADLLGTWVGDKGYTLIAVPIGKEHGFNVIVRPYVEKLTFAPVGAPVPNRGGGKMMLVQAIHYQQVITDKETQETLHFENGMWLLYKDPETQQVEVVRQATVPHGDSVLALGSFKKIDGRPEIPVFRPIDADQSVADNAKLFKYLAAGYGKVADITVLSNDVNKPLRDAIAQQEIINTTIFDVSTANQGGIINIPFITKHADTRNFACTFWLEKVKGPGGQESLQLQYFQQIDLFFFHFLDPQQLICWPHTTVNTLVKE